jgi:hypothetical protein
VPGVRCRVSGARDWGAGDWGQGKNSRKKAVSSKQKAVRSKLQAVGAGKKAIQNLKFKVAPVPSPPVPGT